MRSAGLEPALVVQTGLDRELRVPRSYLRRRERMTVNIPASRENPPTVMPGSISGAWCGGLWLGGGGGGGGGLCLGGGGNWA